MQIFSVQTSHSPAHIFSSIADAPHSFFLDSSATSKGEDRFSFFGAEPYRRVFSLSELECELDALGRSISDVPSSLSHIPFLGGAVGFIGYDAVRTWERHLKSKKVEPFCTPDFFFGLYDTFCAYHHKSETLFIISLGATNESHQKFERLKEHSLKKNQAPKYVSRTVGATIQSNLTFEEYCTMITRAKTYIEDGEIYQVNLSQCLYTPLQEAPYGIYLKLRETNPANFSAYINGIDWQLLSSSPERLISVNMNGLIQTEPIKGTIRRGTTPQEDETLQQQLLTSEKDRAELMMIVDLERNDLGKICDYGTVRVTDLYTLRSYAAVHHMVSTIQGKLKTRRLSDIVQACFPGGSITGAPKLRAMQIIDELEPHNRGVYTGSIGYIDYRGQADLNIAIRTITHQRGTYYFPVGGGIVSDSNPKQEFEETLHKGKALISAVSQE